MKSAFLILMFVPLFANGQKNCTNCVIIRQVGNTNFYFWPLHISPRSDKVDIDNQLDYAFYYTVSNKTYSQITSYLKNYHTNHGDTTRKMPHPSCFNCYEIDIVTGNISDVYVIKTNLEAQRYLNDFLHYLGMICVKKRLYKAIEEMSISTNRYISENYLKQ